MTETARAINKKLPSVKFVAVIIWLTLSLALAGWWLLFGLKQLDKIAGLQNASAQDILRQHRMLMSEGGFLFGLLLIGGVSLLYYISVEISRAKRIQTFFAAFTHDLKTSLASLRLQAEALEEDLKGHQTELPKRIIRDTVRLELQLNNALTLAQDDDNKFYIEALSLKRAVESMKQQWVDLDVKVESDCLLNVDARAIESICKNIIQNALIHGKAKNLMISCKRVSDARVQINFKDDGSGFKGKDKSLAKLFVRHSSTSGTGIGLYIVKDLCQRLGGDCEFFNPENGFLVTVFLPGRLK